MRRGKQGQAPDGIWLTETSAIIERADDTRATVRPALDLKDGTNHAGPVVHDAQPHTAAACQWENPPHYRAP